MTRNYHLLIGTISSFVLQDFLVWNVVVCVSFVLAVFTNSKPHVKVSGYSRLDRESAEMLPELSDDFCLVIIFCFNWTRKPLLTDSATWKVKNLSPYWLLLLTIGKQVCVRLFHQSGANHVSSTNFGQVLQIDHRTTLEWDHVETGSPSVKWNYLHKFCCGGWLRGNLYWRTRSPQDGVITFKLSWTEGNLQERRQSELPNRKAICRRNKNVCLSNSLVALAMKNCIGWDEHTRCKDCVSFLKRETFM